MFKTWSSRKAQLSLLTFILPFTISSVAFFMGKMTSAEWIGLVEWTSTATLGLYGAANLTETHLTKNSNKTENVNK